MQKLESNLDGTILFEERPDTSCPLGTGDPYPPVAAVQDRGQGRGEVRSMITIFAEYYTLQLENPGFTLGPILRKFEMRFESSAPDLPHQLNFQSAVQGSGKSLRQWSDRVLTLVTQTFPQLPDVHAHAISRLC